MNQNHAPASWRVRVAAYLIDSAIPFVGAALFSFCLFIVFGYDLSVGLGTIESDTPDWMPILILAGVAAGGVIGVGYFIQWLIALKGGRTPGKRIVGIRVVKASGESPGWGAMFVREILANFFQFTLVANMVFGAARQEYPLFSLLGPALWPLLTALAIAQAVNLLWPLWDGDSQALHDKALGTRVIYD